ncbi:MAG: hypothetical protein H6629_23675 [Calditrichae bacterium]|nr:hypothetical protein [Calditrichia bacterium]
MAKLIKAILFILISTEMIFSQSESTILTDNIRPNWTTSDSIMYLNIPDRPANALTGSAFVNQVKNLSIINREIAVVSEILSGNVPSFSRKLKAITINQSISGNSYTLIFIRCAIIWRSDRIRIIFTYQ